MPGAADCRPLESEGRPAGWPDRWAVPGVCIFLAVAVWMVFGQTLRHGFANLDDKEYVYENLEVARGLTLQGIVWAFTHVYASNWHPLTWISHMLDCQLYGLNPGGHHLTNVLLHMAAAILLFLVLRRMTGFVWRSAFVAAVFAIHPLRVESVAWVSERKDVLSGVFFMLTLWAYVRYAQRRSRVQPSSLRFAAPGHRESSAGGGSLSLDPRLWTLDYGLVVMFFVLGLMCKPMLVTLPFVLLLLDYWPLNRVANVTSATVTDRRYRTHFPIARRLIIEKLPLFGLAAASCAATLFAQTEAIQPFEALSLPLRAGNALISCVMYLGQMLWPSGLAVFYPFAAGGVGVSSIVLSLAVLAGISAGAFVLRRQRPYLLTGWLWYLIMLAPVIGMVQVGAQALADRYTYLPQIGVYVMLTWAVDLCAGWRHRRVALGGGAAIILMALIFCGRAQTAYWRNSESLWTHALACTTDNWVAHNNLGNALLKNGAVDEAIAQFQKALEIKPDYAVAHYNLGNALLKRGSVDEGMAHYQRALQIKPDYAVAHNNLGNALLKNGAVDEAIAHFQSALQIKPDYADAHYNLGLALFKKGAVDEAMVQYQKALEINPDSAETHYNLGNALLQKGAVDEAITQFQRALQIKPDYADAHYNLGNALLKKGSVDEGMAHYQRALEINPDHALAHNNLGNVLFEKGSVDEAMIQYQKALEINPDSAEAHYNLGNALLQKGAVDQAITHFQRALQITPDYAEAHYNLGNALLKRGSVGEAIVQYQKALQIRPDHVQTLNNLALVLATCAQASLRNGHQAVALAQRANQLTGDGNPAVLGTLAAACAEAGRFPEAVETAQRALQLAGTQSNPALAEVLRSQLKLYQAGIPFHVH
jgi:tetratricopeptide (TPR) repeat protein